VIVDTLVFVSILMQALAIVLACVLAYAAVRWCRHCKPSGVDLNINSATVLVPTLGVEPSLLVCLRSLADIRPGPIAKVIVLLQSAPASASSMLCHGWQGHCPLDVINLGSQTGKPAAIRRGLREVRTKWTVLLDSDVRLRVGAVEQLLRGASHGDAAYGLIASAPMGSAWVDTIVRTDKVVSHGIWRLGRMAIGWWPNIPGQCYAIRTALLAAVYDEHMGHLDDLGVSLRIAALRSHLNASAISALTRMTSPGARSTVSPPTRVWP
jgi:hypothetical protein